MKGSKSRLKEDWLPPILRPKRVIYNYPRRPRLNQVAKADRIPDPFTAMLLRASVRSKKKGSEFSIKVEDLDVPEFCPYLGIRLEYGSGDASPSIDRIDNTKGYIPGNVQVISKLANCMKLTASLDTLRTFAKNILRLHSDGY